MGQITTSGSAVASVGDEALISEQLERIIAHELFRDTTRMKRFLRYIVVETLAGRGGRLKGYAIGIEVFDRPDDFDPQGDTIVRVQAGQLRRRLDLYYSRDGRNDLVRIMVPKGRYSPIFEIRKDAPKPEQDLDDIASSETSVSNQTSGKSVSRPSVAVMSFDDLTQPDEDGGTSKSYFAEGLTAEVVNALVQFRSIRTVTMTPSVSSHLKDKSVTEIGAEFNADFVLSGNIRRQQDVFRVVVNLMSTHTGEHLFSRIYDRELQPGNLFDVQEDIASYTAASVAAPFGAVNRFNRRQGAGRQKSMRAYEALLQFYDMQLAPNRARAEALLAEFKDLTEIDPLFSTGWAVRSLLSTFLYTQCFPIADPEESIRASIQDGRKATSTDPTNALGFYALFQAYYHSGDMTKAGDMIRKALALNPNDYWMLAYYAVALAFHGDMDRAKTMQGAAMRLIGRAPSWFHIPDAVAKFKAGEFETVSDAMPENLVTASAAFQFLGLAAKGYLGQPGEAETLLKSLVNEIANYPEELEKALPYWQMDPEFYALALDGLKRAGLDIGEAVSE